MIIIIIINILIIIYYNFHNSYLDLSFFEILIFVFGLPTLNVLP